MAIDWDKIFKYKTFKMVKMLDVRLGILKYAIMVIIVLYITLFVLWYKKGYLDFELSEGQVEFIVQGKSSFLVDKKPVVVDSIDLTDPGIEHGALFVVSREEMVRQTRGLCGNPVFPCDTNEDCPTDPPIARGSCVEGFCEELGWCPPLDPADSDNTKILQYQSPQNLTIWIRGAISFPGLDPDATFTTMHAEYPIYRTDDPIKANAFYIWELLELAGVNPASVLEDGCFLSVLMNWDCYLDTKEGCYTPQMEVKRLDVGSAAGFDIYDGDYIRSPNGDPSKESRIFSRRVGFRFLIAAKGTGYKVSLAAIILQFSSGIALLGVAGLVADFLMLVVLPERDHYRQYKEQNTPDFSDLRDKIADEDEDSKKLRASSKSSRYEKMFDKKA
jgi:hypothetical protein